ncbi:MAG: GNAT family N-acetyltransferase [Verrucomicrobiales bacterium]
MPGPFSICQLDWDSGRDALLTVRREVFVVEQQVPEEIEVDEHDPVSLHFLAVDSTGLPIGTARLLSNGRVGRMAVREDWRRSGVGRALLTEVIATARRRGDSRLFLHAQVHSIPFYESLGFVVCGDEFEEAGIPHREMHRVL